MLNISPQSIDPYFFQRTYKSLLYLKMMRSWTSVNRVLRILLFFMILALFLPWTQNIQSRGFVTTIGSEQRPQEIPSPIPGQIVAWNIREGMHVRKGDTLVLISEIKSEYLDPNLVSRTESQIHAKKQAIAAYEEKIENTLAAIKALDRNFQIEYEQAQLKYQQAWNDYQSDSAYYASAQVAYEIAKTQYERIYDLFTKGLKSKMEMENYRNKLWEKEASLQSALMKWNSSKNKVEIARLEMDNKIASYQMKRAEKQAYLNETYSALNQAQAELAKLENLRENYFRRFAMHGIRAPQEGYVTKLQKKGIGEVVYEGEALFTFVPESIQYAVEIYVRPLNMPLISEGLRANIQFDGWPAIVFSGWPQISYGTYPGIVYAWDRMIHSDGTFRVLIKEDPKGPKWPSPLAPGGGARAILFLKVVPLWYEIWRQLNGFPPDFYKPTTDETNSKKQKKE